MDYCSYVHAYHKALVNQFVFSSQPAAPMIEGTETHAPELTTRRTDLLLPYLLVQPIRHHLRNLEIIFLQHHHVAIAADT